MEILLIASLFSCSELTQMKLDLEAHAGMSIEIKKAIIDELQKNAPEGCILTSPKA